MIRNTKEINDLNYGGKAYGLNKLFKLGVKVPEAYAINQEFINKLISNDEETINSLVDTLNKFNKQTQFAIRSSASNEDGKEKSFAGMYESILNVPNELNEVLNAIQKVNDSLSSNRLNSYNNNQTNMNIVIQEMINPVLAGVCFTNSIDFNGDDVLYVEYVDGLGENLVSGKKTAKNIIVNSSDYSYRMDELEKKERFMDLINNLKIIKEKCSEPLDLEWCIDENDTAYFVQARPVTRKVIVRKQMSNGAIASPGFCSGKVYKIDEDVSDEELNELIKNAPIGCVLVAKTTDTNYVPAMKKAAGIITTEGSVLSHAAIIAREFGIPCITGYKDAFNIFENGKILTLDTNKMHISYDGNEVLFGNGKEINLLELYNFDYISEEYVNDNLVLVETVDDEFGIHIDEDLEQEQIDEIEIFIRKKYKKSPIILKDQKYLWYTEFKRYQKFPNYMEKCNKVLEICNNFDINGLESLVDELLQELEEKYNECANEFDCVYFGEYAQAIHFLINLYMCNGAAMEAMYNYIKNNKCNSVQEVLSGNSIQSEFLKEIEKIRGSIWEKFVNNGWSNDNYYDNREETLAHGLHYNGDIDYVIDYFYNHVVCDNFIKVKKKF